MGTENGEDQTKCQLLELSGELRNRIYRLCLVEPDSVIVASINREDVNDGTSVASNTRWTVRLPHQPQILSTCKTIRTEALPIWYGENTFHVPAPDFAQSKPGTVSEHAVRSLARKLSPTQTKAIRMLRIGKMLQSRDIARDVLVYVSAAWLTCRLSPQNNIEIVLEQRNGGEYSGDVRRSLCACDLRKAARSSRSRKNQGSTLISVVRIFTDKYLHTLNPLPCKSCGCIMLYRMID
ncbi:hypothetical protein CKM354_001200200 [Cercospora kikuchii]|uniref:Uncharacterized protein n=1 Tax=Cercospora kikuchii TaxID=84275 RepID=A0A9P3FL90_9PEZI|nr:uncharacterized protein CKM354_001200200 [Cercospora kikuchii]GIZ48959.1 hypothetical protein CKM354_001200200 [Cercospora kikuchii]